MDLSFKEQRGKNNTVLQKCKSFQKKFWFPSCLRGIIKKICPKNQRYSPTTRSTNPRGRNFQTLTEEHRGGIEIMTGKVIIYGKAG